MSPVGEPYFDAGGMLYSPGYDDRYHGSADAIGESRHVFLEPNRLPRRWQEHQRSLFTLVELGFGTGLNFLVTWREWQRHRGQRGGVCRRLHYLALERHPLRRRQLRRALAAHPELADLAEQLTAAWSDAATELQALWFDAEQLSLTVWQADALATLEQLDAGSGPGVDGWYLDGFAPDRNPAMWQPSIFAQMARLSAPGARLGTFTAAGRVRRALADAGFEVTRRPGFGNKREMLTGTWPDNAPDQGARPWFAAARDPVPGRVAIVGAGLAGAATALALARRGVACTVVDGAGPAAGASGNPAGTLYPRLARQLDSATRLSLQAMDRAWARLGELERAGATVRHGQQGALLRIEPGEQQPRQADIAATDYARERGLALLEAEAASERSGCKLEWPALWVPGGGWADPGGLTRAQLAAAEATGNCRVHEGVRIQPPGNGGDWRAALARAGIVADTVVLCAGAGALDWFADRDLPLHAIRGVVSLLPATRATGGLACALCQPGYLTPAVDGQHAVGATFNRDDPEPTPRPADREHNRAVAATLLGRDVGHHELHGERVAWRVTTPDTLPVVGALPDWDGVAAAGSTSGRGSPDRRPVPPLQPGVFVNLAHGARGITTGVIAGEAIAAELCGEIAPLTLEQRAHLHPARFLIRALRKNRR